MGGRFVLIIKDKRSSEQKYKAQFVVQGHNDSKKNILVQASTNIRQHTIRMINAMAAIDDFNLWSKDVSQAYIQSRSDLRRDVYIRPKQGFNLKSDELL